MIKELTRFDLIFLVLFMSGNLIVLFSFGYWAGILSVGISWFLYAIIKYWKKGYLVEHDVSTVNDN